MSDLESIKEVVEKQSQALAAVNAEDPMMKKSTTIVEEFLKAHRVLCYGGTAINNLLPLKDRFYEPGDVPDYDFFSETPQEHSVIVANKLSAAGIGNIEVKPGVHLGTYKVFADFHGVADITLLAPKVFDNLWKEKIDRHGIHYVPPNFLRMSMYLELSRPDGDISRWEKVYTRLLLLNKHFPIVCKDTIVPPEEMSIEQKKDAISMMKNHDVVLIGFSAMTRYENKAHWYTPLTLLAENNVIEQVSKGKKTLEHEETEIIPRRVDVLDDNGGVLYQFYETQACHSYHSTGDGLKIASIPTLLQFFLALIYSGEPKDEVTRILCVAQRLMELAANKPNRALALLTPTSCLGKQPSLLELRRERVGLFKKINSKTSPEFVQYFFTYNPKATKTERKKIRDLLKKTRKARLNEV
jgi:hypothetical protein